MMGKKCCCRGMCLCPFSFGLAVGITSFLAVFIWGVWMMHSGMPQIGMARALGMPLTWGATFAAAVWALIKGFVFAFVVAGIYDFFACYLKSKCAAKHGSDKNVCCCSDGKGMSEHKKRH